VANLLLIPILLILFSFSSHAIAGRANFCLRVLAEETLSAEAPLVLSLEEFIPSLASGRSNRGIYIYYDAEGRRHAVKVLDFGPDQNHRDQSIEVAVEGAKLLELAGGAKFYGFGVIEVREGPITGKFYFLDLECLGPGVELKTDRMQSIVDLLPTVEARAALPVEMSRNLIDSIEKRIFASDPDFWIEPLGKVRWIDSGEWRKLVSDKADLKYTAGTIWYFIYKLSQLDHRMGTAMAPRFLKDFLARLGNSTAISKDDRHTLIELFTDLPSHDSQGTARPLWADHFLIRSGILPSNQRNREEASAMFYHYCVGAMQRLP